MNQPPAFISTQDKTAISMSASKLVFQKKHKLLTKHDFAQVFARPGKQHHGCFTILYRPNQLGFSRLGLAVAKKALRRAVARNIFKRQVRESFRLIMLAQDGHQDVKQAKLAGSESLAMKGLDIVVIAKAAAGQQSKQAIRNALDQQWQLLIASCS